MQTEGRREGGTEGYIAGTCQYFSQEGDEGKIEIFEKNPSGALPKS